MTKTTATRLVEVLKTSGMREKGIAWVLQMMKPGELEKRRERDEKRQQKRLARFAKARP